MSQDYCEDEKEALRLSLHQLESQLAETKAKLADVRMQASKGLYTPEKEAELERLKCYFKKSLELGELLGIYLSRSDRDEHLEAVARWQSFRKQSEGL